MIKNNLLDFPWRPSWQTELKFAIFGWVLSCLIEKSWYYSGTRMYHNLDFFSWKITKLGWPNVQTRLGGTCGPGAFPGATQKNLQPCKPWPGQPPKKIVIKTKNYHPFFPGLWMLSERTHPRIIRVYRKITRTTSDIVFDDKWNHMLAENTRKLMSNWDWSPQMLQTCPSRNVNTAI